MKKILSVVVLSALSMLVHGQALRIMPLGNSITQSENTHLSYRYNLWVKLKASGISFDFVGSLNTNFAGNPTFPDPTFDKDHEGHWGWRADELLAGLPTWLQGYTPDIVLMHVGTNDLFQGQTIASTVSEIKSIIDLVRGDNPNVTILLAKLIGTSGATNNSAIVQLNDQMSAIANEKNTAASKVIVVDQYTGFDPVVDTSDGIHPDASGEEKMAQKWFDAISALTTPTDSEAPTMPDGLTSSNVTQTGFTLSWTASADAVGVTGYEVLLNGTSIGTPSGTTFNVTGLAPATVCSMRVRARDLAGNWSALSNALSVTTLALDGIQSFYRAVNLNGPTLTIDGNNWVSSTGAPNFSITTNLWGFENQSVPLLPPTDVNRATMIRSSMFGNTVSIAMSAVPNATYDVWLYVWEDNSPQTYSVSLEGTVVRADFNSGAAGAWTKLGPFTRTISDGTINIVTQGGHANVSGVEVWRAGQPPTNSPPVISNPVPDQFATATTAFSYTFPANTFSDPDVGTTLSYSATQSSGAALPGWLGFNASTRTFAGTPSVNDVTTVNIMITASDGAASVADVFALTVNSVTKVTPVLTWADPAAIVVGTALGAAQLNATATSGGSVVAGTFAYTPAAGTVLSVGDNHPLSVTFTPTNTSLFNSANATAMIDVLPTGSTTNFYRAVNVNGPTLTIDGNNWVSSTGAPNFSITTNMWGFENQSVPLLPPTDANRATMIRSSMFGNTVSIAMSAVPNATYDVWLYVWEDNSPQTYSVSLEGTVVRADFNSGAAGAWTKLGPFTRTISDGTINIVTQGGHANVSGVEVWRAGQPPTNSPPVISNPVPDQFATATTAFSYTFPANTFSDPDAGTTLSYSATQSSGAALPGWLGFNASTRTFAGTPSVNDVTTVNIMITASDGAASVADVFALTVNSVTKVTPVLTWADPAAIVVGTALGAAQLNATATSGGSVVAGTFAYTPSAGTVLSVGDDQPLSVTFTPTNTSQFNSATATAMIDVLPTGSTTNFYRAVNVNGPALTIDGNNWVSSTGAPNFSITTNLWGFENQSVPLLPPTDANRATMIRSSMFGNTVSIAMSAVPNATYDVWLYVWEDNSPQTYSVSLEGTVVRADFNSGAAGAWTRLGPFTRTISDGTINIVTQGGHANVSGIEVFTATQAAARMSTGVQAAEVSSADEEDFPEGLHLLTFPNPSEKEVVISFNSVESAVTDLAIYDSRGRKVVPVFKGNTVAGQIQKFTVDTSDLQNGLYIITLVTGRRIERRKHIVAH